MLKDWFLGKVHPRALESSTKEVKAFVDGLKAMSDEDIGTIIAVATLIRINFETHGVIPEDVFEAGPLPKVEALGGYQLAINRLARKFKKMGLATDAMGAMVWSYTLRCLNVPELRELGLQMWAELRRGFPHVEKALKKGEEEKGSLFPSAFGRNGNPFPPVSATREPPETSNLGREKSAAGCVGAFFGDKVAFRLLR